MDLRFSNSVISLPDDGSDKPKHETRNNFGTDTFRS